MAPGTMASAGPDVPDTPIRAYIAQVAQSELRRFVPGDAIPEDLLRLLVREWSSPANHTARLDRPLESIRCLHSKGRKGANQLPKRGTGHWVAPSFSLECNDLDSARL